MADRPRSEMRNKATTFRMCESDFEALRLEMKRAGLGSLQELLEVKVFGQRKPRRKPGPQPRRPIDGQEGLPISA